MKNDCAPEIRRIVASRISDEEAVELLEDDDWLVRYTAAQHAPAAALAPLLADTEPDVRGIAEQRLNKTPSEKSDD